MIYGLLIIIVGFLAFSNGSNDNFKGVATLYGSKTFDFKKSLHWASLTVLLGGCSSVFFSDQLLKNFSGKGLIPNELLHNPHFVSSIALAAALTVFFATKIGMPISTTHAIIGSLAGLGIYNSSESFNYAKLFKEFFLPLIASPFIAIFLSVLSYKILSKIKLSINSKTIDRLHITTSGLVGFARGLNDTPKIAGILLIIPFIKNYVILIFVVVLMIVGGIINSKKVAENMSNKITKIDQFDGFSTNLTTSVIVILASLMKLPVSTTHVSVGTIFGLSFITKIFDKKLVMNIIYSWIFTLPISGIFSIFIFTLTKNLAL